jgi:hypothetical protein
LKLIATDATTRTKRELVANWQYPTLADGLALL